MSPTIPSSPTDALYKDPWQPVESRVKDLLSRMTLQEKAAQMAQIERRVSSPNSLTGLSIGSVLNAGGSAPKERATAEEWADMVDEFQSWALESRLGIPIVYATDAVHGNNNVYGATVFPHNVAIGATRDVDLVRRIGAATALEVRATGIHCTFAPCVAVCRDPRWGRCYESYSEDSGVVYEMASIVSGLQGFPPRNHPNGYPFIAERYADCLQLYLYSSMLAEICWEEIQPQMCVECFAGNARYMLIHCLMRTNLIVFCYLKSVRTNVIACAKHFVGDGGTNDGVNEGDAICSFEELEKVHMKPYLECLAQGVSMVMASYSSWNGSKLHSDRFLITDILKGKLGFKGIVISDWEGIDKLCQPHGSDNRFCILASINAGIDMVMVPYRYEQFLEDLIFLVESGEIPITRVNDAVERILRVKFVAGLFEHPFSDRSLMKFVGCKEHRELAREAVRKSLVLLKNGKDTKHPFLPLDKNAKKILVTGTHANDIGYQCGGWTIAWHGGKGSITTGTTILEGIKEVVGESTQVIHEEFPSAATLEEQDLSFAIVVVGEEPYAESTGDRRELNIPLKGAEVMEKVAAKVPTLAILVSGRPLLIEPKLLKQVESVVAAWLPGTEGGGVADVLFGEYDFEGVLPVTWFRTIQQLPMNKEQPSYDPLFPIGFGLKMCST